MLCKPFITRWHFCDIIDLGITVSEWLRKDKHSNTFLGDLRFILSRLSDHCLSVLSCLSVRPVTLVYCGQMVRWIKMKLGVQVGLGTGHTVLHVEPAAPLERGTAAPSRFACYHIIQGPRLLWPNGWLDQDSMWCESRSRLAPHCVRWGPSYPFGKGHSSPLLLCLQPYDPRPTSIVDKRLAGSRCHVVWK